MTGYVDDNWQWSIEMAYNAVIRWNVCCDIVSSNFLSVLCFRRWSWTTVVQHSHFHHFLPIPFHSVNLEIATNHEFTIHWCWNLELLIYYDELGNSESLRAFKDTHRRNPEIFFRRRVFRQWKRLLSGVAILIICRTAGSENTPRKITNKQH